MNPKLISKRSLPPGGFSYTQPETGVSFPGMTSFYGQVEAIVAHRKGNRLARATPVEVSEDLEAHTCARIPTACRNVTELKKKEQPTQPGLLRRAAQRVVDGLSKATRGAKTMAAWLGDGGQPVPTEKAESRSSICILCPHNQPESGYAMTKDVAETVKSWMEARNNLKLSTSNDSKLGVCEVCGCHLKLKVHTPLPAVMEGTPDGLLDLFPKGLCWIRTELENKETTTQ